MTVPLASVVVAVLLTLAVTSMTSTAAGTSYAEDRAAIEDLQARYLFAMDFGDPDLYVTMLWPLRGRDGEGERPVVLHQAENLQRAAGRVGL
jgi:hypothetical protein